MMHISLRLMIAQSQSTYKFNPSCLTITFPLYFRSIMALFLHLSPLPMPELSIDIIFSSTTMFQLLNKLDPKSAEGQMHFSRCFLKMQFQLTILRLLSHTSFQSPVQIHIFLNPGSSLYNTIIPER